MEGQGGHKCTYISSFIAGYEQHDSDFALGFKSFSDCIFSTGIEVFINGGDALDLSFLLGGLFFDAALLDCLLGLLPLCDGLGLAGGLLRYCCRLGGLGSLELFVLLLVCTSYSGHC